MKITYDLVDVERIEKIIESTSFEVKGSNVFAKVHIPQGAGNAVATEVRWPLLRCGLSSGGILDDRIPNLHEMTPKAKARWEEFIKTTIKTIKSEFAKR